MEFVCESCEWSGTQPVTDAHLNAFCPTCGKLAEFAEIAQARRERRAQRAARNE